MFLAFSVDALPRGTKATEDQQNHKRKEEKQKNKKELAHKKSR